MEALLGGTPSKQIDTGAPECVGAGSGEDKLDASLLFNERMDHLEEFGQLLDFVNDTKYMVIVAKF